MLSTRIHYFVPIPPFLDPGNRGWQGQEHRSIHHRGQRSGPTAGHHHLPGQRSRYVRLPVNTLAPGCIPPTPSKRVQKLPLIFFHRTFKLNCILIIKHWLLNNLHFIRNCTKLQELQSRSIKQRSVCRSVHLLFDQNPKGLSSRSLSYSNELGAKLWSEETCRPSLWHGYVWIV